MTGLIVASPAFSLLFCPTPRPSQIVVAMAMLLKLCFSTSSFSFCLALSGHCGHAWGRPHAPLCAPAAADSHPLASEGADGGLHTWVAVPSILGGSTPYNCLLTVTHDTYLAAAPGFLPPVLQARGNYTSGIPAFFCWSHLLCWFIYWYRCEDLKLVPAFFPSPNFTAEREKEADRPASSAALAHESTALLTTPMYCPPYL